MGKQKNRNQQSEENLVKEIKKLEQENRRLNQLLKQYKKWAEKPVEETQEDKLAKIKARNVIKCQECAKGYLKEIEIAGRIFDVCQTCKWRSKPKRAMKRK